MEVISNKELLAYSVSTLAWIGDAVFELQIRSLLARRHPATSGKLHHMATAFVSAGGQANLLDALSNGSCDFPLSEQEANLLQRARNFHCHSAPRHADPADYRQATAFEALIGWLWLNGQNERIAKLVDFAIRHSGMMELYELDNHDS